MHRSRSWLVLAFLCWFARGFLGPPNYSHNCPNQKAPSPCWWGWFLTDLSWDCQKVVSPCRALTSTGLMAMAFRPSTGQHAKVTLQLCRRYWMQEPMLKARDGRALVWLFLGAGNATISRSSNNHQQINNQPTLHWSRQTIKQLKPCEISAHIRHS